MALVVISKKELFVFAHKKTCWKFRVATLFRYVRRTSQAVGVAAVALPVCALLAEVEAEGVWEREVEEWR